MRITGMLRQSSLTLENPLFRLCDTAYLTVTRLSTRQPLSTYASLL
jgi:hypothetical protein